MDKYSCFEHLSANESKGIDYEVLLRPGSSGIAIISVHGGAIEPGTSEIAEAVAGADHTYYALAGIKKTGNRDLHITSTRFDEPAAIEIVQRSQTVVSIHGSSEEEETVLVGGRDTGLKECVIEKLTQAGFKTQGTGNPRLALKEDEKFRDLRGRDTNNICNRNMRSMGVQLEISKGLRARMFEGLSQSTGTGRGKAFQDFVLALREAIELFIS
jgi:phage replication-related protein YjqB (UPF0714/DUF867 family)